MLSQFYLPRIPVCIRTAQHDDLSKLGWDPTPSSDDGLEHHLMQQNVGEALFLIATIADLPIGHAQVTWHDVGNGREYPEIVHLAVFDALKGYGIGTALLEACEHACRDRGFKKVGLRVNPITEPRWRVLYERLGYRYASASNGTAETRSISLELVKEL